MPGFQLEGRRMRWVADLKAKLARARAGFRK